MTDFSQKFRNSKWFTGGLLFASVFWAMAEIYAQTAGPLDGEDIRDIMVKRPPASIIPVIFSLLALIGVLIVGVIVVKRILTRQPEMGRVPPEYIAQSRLQQICSKMENEAPNKVSLEISEAVKDFLMAQFQDPIRFETAEEYLNRISQVTESNSIKFSTTLTEEVRSFMNISQELKFAQLREARTRIPALVNQAMKIIEMAVQEKVRRPKR
jgi:hypothetical protein